MSEELQRWRHVVIELCEDFTLSFIAAEVGVSERQVSKWKAGTDRPLGFNAVRLYLFHAKHRTPVPVDRTPVPSETKA